MNDLKRIAKTTIAAGLLVALSTTIVYAQAKDNILTKDNMLKLTSQSEPTIQTFAQTQENKALELDIDKIIERLPKTTNNSSIENLIAKEELVKEDLIKEELSKPKLTNESVAKLILNGDYGNGQERKDKLENEGYNVKEVQSEVDKIALKIVAKAETNIKSSNMTKSHSTQSVSRSSSSRSIQDQKMTMQATAYSTAQPELGRYTADGTDLHTNPMVIAVDPKVIPLGTKVTVEGYGTYVAADTGGAIKGNRIDIHFKTVQECVNFGRRPVNIVVHK